MLGCFRRWVGRPLDPNVVQEKKLKSEKKKAQKKLAVLRKLYRRQSNKRQHALHFHLFDFAEFIDLYTSQKDQIKRIPLEECIEGLQRVYGDMKRLEVTMKKHKLGIFPWMAQSWSNYWSNRAYDREEARRIREENRRMDSIPFRP
ncbi:unnamed protein product [Caenorhabditis brenneri]